MHDRHRRHRSTRPARITLVALLLAAAAPSALAGDGITLSAREGETSAEVVLTWTGRVPTFEVYASADPTIVLGANTLVGQTANYQWNDYPPSRPLTCYLVKSRPPVLDDLLPAASALASSMETLRVLDESISVGGSVLNSAEFLHLASRSLLALESEDPFPPSTPPPGLAPPPDPYPTISLDDAFYSSAFTRDGYLAFLRQLDDHYVANGAYPESLAVAGTTGEVRYADMVYYAAGLLRARQILGYLPEHWTRYVISTRDLVPWDTPPGYEEYTAALESYNGIPYFPNQARRYYGSTAHRYEMLDLSRSIIGNTGNAYLAGEKLYDWVMNVWQNVVGYTSARLQYRADRSQWEMAHDFFHTSGVPRRITSGLFRAAGLPASISGAAYFDGRGWVNIDVHRPYGSNPLENPFYYDDIPPPTHTMPPPTPTDDFIVKIKSISARTPVPAAPGERRSVVLNPADVQQYGAEYVLDHAGDFDTLVLTVKTFKGYLYYGSTGWPEREQYDALAPLIQEAHARGKQVYAGFSTLGDYLTGAENPTWKQKLNDDGTYPNAQISPCVQAYRDRLTGLLTALVTNYDVDGVVLDYLFYANVFGNTDTVGHPECPTGTDWMPGALDSAAAAMVNAIEAADPSVETVIVSYPLGNENRYFGLAPVENGHQDLQTLSQIADRVMLVVLGTYWLPQATPWWETLIADYQALTGEDPWVSFMLVDEWEYSPRVYRGTAFRARQLGISGFNLHSPLSSLGELGPALSRPEWQLISATDLPE